MVNSPEPLLFTARVTACAVSAAVTKAPGITAPVESCTVPKILPVFCATAGRAASIIAPANRTMSRTRDTAGKVVQNTAVLRNGPEDLMLFMPYSIFLDKYWSDHNDRGKYAFLSLQLSSVSCRKLIKPH